MWTAKKGLFLNVGQLKRSLTVCIRVRFGPRVFASVVSHDICQCVPKKSMFPDWLRIWKDPQMFPVPLRYIPPHTEILGKNYYGFDVTLDLSLWWGVWLSIIWWKKVEWFAIIERSRCIPYRKSVVWLRLLLWSVSFCYQFLPDFHKGSSQQVPVLLPFSIINHLAVIF